MKNKNFPIKSIIILFIIVLGCIIIPLISTKEANYINIGFFDLKPSSRFWFGTDSLGRSVFLMIWNGGRVSLIIGSIATIVSTIIGVVYGTISGLSVKIVDEVLMRVVEIVLSIPSILLVIFIQGVLGKSNIISISIVIGVTSWMTIAKLVRNEVRQMKNSDYILAAKTMGANYFYILREHLIPNFMPTIIFVVITNISTAIGIESTLSFMGIGLSVDIISWGTLLSLANDALLTNSWWLIIIPGIFLITTLLSIINIGNYIRKNNSKQGRII